MSNLRRPIYLGAALHPVQEERGGTAIQWTLVLTLARCQN